MTNKIKTKEITIEPVTRLEGEAKISIFLNDAGNVDNAYFQTIEYKGFEKFCVGRPVEELARITPRICGVCPGAHAMASTKALDAVFNAEAPQRAKKTREVFYSAFTIHDHLFHFYMLASPDFILGMDAPREKRNIFGVVDKVGIELGKKILNNMRNMHLIQEEIGGKAVHPVFGLPGGMPKGINNENRKKMVAYFSQVVDFLKESLDMFENDILEKYIDVIMNDRYINETHYMGLVDKNNKVNLYDGKIRVVDVDGNELYKFNADDYLDYIDEKVVDWTYIKFPYLKKKGWKGIKGGKDSGVYCVGPLARMNVSEGFTTPLAQERYKKFYKKFNAKPVHNTLAMHWARLIGGLYAAEHGLELVKDRSITRGELRGEFGIPNEGVGVVEAPRGTLIHHYKSDNEGITTNVNLIVATTHNNAGICMSVEKAAKALIKNWKVNDGLLNQIEMAFRAYDPCLACATHTLMGDMPLDIGIYDSKKNVYKELRRTG